MAEILSDIEIRVLGSLIEKQMSTPEYYPLTLNSLTSACNQKSNRHPVMNLSEKDVVRALDGLRGKGLARVTHLAGSRVPKYEHSFQSVYGVDAAESAVLCELMLRGPQTLGELRGRASRLRMLESLDEVERVLEGLMGDGREASLVLKLPRQPGRKESRFAHLLAGAVEIGEEADAAPPDEPATVVVRTEDQRIRRLEEEVESLRKEVSELKATFGSFRSQFE